MYRVTREIHFCYGHRLLDYQGKCRHLHGHNGKAVIVLETAQLDRLGMVVDFSEVKRVVGGWIDATLDHKMILHRDDPVLPYLREQNEPVYVIDCNPTAENIARLIFNFVKSQGFPVVEVTLWETENSFATYSECANGNGSRGHGQPAEISGDSELIPMW
jgi:6-pyruvoyltetrahydropterin/6-carboxytetrahydropterin synthase